MNSPKQPLSPDTLDELLSADIDGELDRAAVELGFTPETARAALEASPAAELRRDALMRARSVLADPPAMEPEAQSRLVAAALARADEERRAATTAVTSESVTPRSVTSQPVTSLASHRARNAWRVLVGVGTAAAVIAGVVALSATNPAGDGAKSSSAPRAISGAANTPALGADLENGAQSSVTFGAVTPPNAFRAKVRQQLQRNAAAPVPTPTTHALSASPKAAAGQKTADSAAGAGEFSEAKRQDCIAALGRQRRIPAAPVLTGSGTKDAQPVIVVVYRRTSSYDVYVLSAADCSVMSRDTLP